MMMSVCLTVHAKKTINYLSETDTPWYESVLRPTVKVFRF